MTLYDSASISISSKHDIVVSMLIVIVFWSCGGHVEGDRDVLWVGGDGEELESLTHLLLTC